MYTAQEILKTKFGYRDFRQQQEDVVNAVLEGKDALVLMPTGGGKSLCYQIPALIRPGTGIVISPLIALMQDQVDALRQLGIRAAFLNSSQSVETQHDIELALSEGALDLLYIAPERLLTERTLSQLDAANLALFAIDEAHCVSQWGHDFRPEYQRLSVLHKRFPKVPRIALTATADSRTRFEISQQLELEDAAVFVSSFDRPNICYTISEASNARHQLWRFIDSEHPDGAGIVYCLSRKKVEDLTQFLCAQGRVALPYHAGLDSSTRRLNQQRFLQETGVIIVATIAFGMGIDKPDVRFVAHMNLPRSIEAYYQETGRAGRDGQPANAWMAYGLQDIITLRQMMRTSDADEKFKLRSSGKLDSLLALCEQTSCRRHTILTYFGEAAPDQCGNCDICLNPPETWDGTEPAQKALSCIYRTGQSFGVNYIIAVLLAKSDQRIERNLHDRISTFGIGVEHNAQQWRSIMRQLIARGYLSTDAEGFGVLKLTEKARQLLRGDIKLELRHTRNETTAKPNRSSASAIHLSNEEQHLFELLRAHRMQLARNRSLPPYVIFHDSTLREIARQCPGSKDELRGVSGIGEKKLSDYGDGILGIVEAYLRSEPK